MFADTEEELRLHRQIDKLVGYLLHNRICPKCGSKGVICDEMPKLDPPTNRYTCINPRCEEVIYGDMLYGD